MFCYPLSKDFVRCYILYITPTTFMPATFSERKDPCKGISESLNSGNFFRAGPFSEIVANGNVTSLSTPCGSWFPVS